jgi:hypothetical protein
MKKSVLFFAAAVKHQVFFLENYHLKTPESALLVNFYHTKGLCPLHVILSLIKKGQDEGIKKKPFSRIPDPLKATGAGFKQR